MERSEKFLEILKKENLNVAKLSKISNVPYTTIRSIIKRNFKDASLDSVIKIAKALNVELSEFIPEIKSSKSNKQLKKELKALKREHKKLIKELDNIFKKATVGKDI